MIIIDEQASGELIQALRNLPMRDGNYCLHFHEAGQDSDQSLRRHLIASALEHLPDSRAYFCEDGEVFLLAQNASAKECREVMFEVSSALKIQSAETIATLYDLSTQAVTLLLMLKKKITHSLKLKETELKMAAQEQAARKRHEILHSELSAGVGNVSAQRNQRTTPELMIIEDDVFSRRLVENVLQKKYALTALGTVDKALSTYTELAPDLLFLDIDLPDVSGHELLERIIALDPEAYVVMLSGNADKENIMQAMSRGAKGFVAKPFTRDKLFQYIERCPTIKESPHAGKR